MPTAREREIASTGCRHRPDASPKLNGIAKEDVRQQTAKPMQSIPRSGMADLQYASCLDSSNHPEADRAPFHLDAILLSKCARNCTLPRHDGVRAWLHAAHASRARAHRGSVRGMRRRGGKALRLAVLGILPGIGSRWTSSAPGNRGAQLLDQPL